MRVCVVDDHEIVREGLRMVLPNDPDVEIVAEAASAREALQALRRHLPDVLVTDYRLPGAELCARVRTDVPSTAVVVLTTYLSEDVVQRCTDAGAAGFVTKAAGLGELRRVLRLAAAGDRTTEMATGGTSALVKRLHEASSAKAAAGGRKQLTPQQERVLELAARGMTYGAISHELHISESTVRFHIQGLKDRLGVRTKAELIATAVRSALIAPGVDAVDG